MPRGTNRQALIEAGLELFTHQGFGATGVQEIADRAEVPKGSFYNYFESKEDFMIAVVQHYRELACLELARLFGELPGTPREKLVGFFETARQQLVDADFGGGCLAGRLCQELAGEHPLVREPLNHAFDCMGATIAEILEAARTEGEIAFSEDPAELAEFLHNGWQGATLRAKAAGSDQPLRNFQRYVFERLLPHPAN